MTITTTTFNSELPAYRLFMDTYFEVKEQGQKRAAEFQAKVDALTAEEVGYTFEEVKELYSTLSDWELTYTDEYEAYIEARNNIEDELAADQPVNEGIGWWDAFDYYLGPGCDQTDYPNFQTAEDVINYVEHGIEPAADCVEVVAVEVVETIEAEATTVPALTPAAPLTWRQVVSLGKSAVLSLLSQLGLAVQSTLQYFKLCSLLYQAL